MCLVGKFILFGIFLFIYRILKAEKGLSPSGTLKVNRSPPTHRSRL